MAAVTSSVTSVLAVVISRCSRRPAPSAATPARSPSSRMARSRSSVVIASRRTLVLSPGAPAPWTSVAAAAPSFGDRGDRPSYGGDREMFQATCATCGGAVKCRFARPATSPSTAKGLFRRQARQRPGPRPTENYAEQFKAINVKLDALLKVIAPAALTAPVVAKAPVAVVKAPVVVAKSPAPAPKAEKPAVIVEKPAVKKPRRPRSLPRPKRRLRRKPGPRRPRSKQTNKERPPGRSFGFLRTNSGR